ncbi:MAG: ATP-binding cassette domain-containing protein [Anaerolineae bacterium]|nr:ATP-binding cassette domain-containing protein [Anaerolineae bacterium]
MTETPSRTADDILLEVRNLKMWFENRSGLFSQNVQYTKAVDDVSFYIKRGETLGLVGESGCGKTTVGRCLVRVYEPTAGQILYHGGDTPVDLAQLNRQELRPYRQDIRMIFQNPYSALNPRMTVFENVAEVLIVNKLASGQELEDRVASLIRRVGLRPEYMRRYPHAFSGGERQRIVIARALATNPRLVVADEAISALDVSIRAQILNLMKELQEEMGLTYLFIAHDLSVVRHICDRVNVMYVGKLVESAPSKELYFHPQHPYTEALMSAVPIHNPRLRGKRERIRLTGDVADPSNPPSGCYFHPRCRYAEARCSVEEPPLRTIHPQTGHQVACHFAEELDLQGVVATSDE